MPCAPHRGLQHEAGPAESALANGHERLRAEKTGCSSESRKLEGFVEGDWREKNAKLRLKCIHSRSTGS